MSLGPSQRRAVALALAALLLGVAFASVDRAWRASRPPTRRRAPTCASPWTGTGDARTASPTSRIEAQHAGYSIRDYRKRASDRVAAAYPEPERTRLLEAYSAHATRPTAPTCGSTWPSSAAGSAACAAISRASPRWRRAASAPPSRPRGTRYGFRRRENGIWGLTLFTAELAAEAERAARDADDGGEGGERLRAGKRRSAQRLPAFCLSSAYEPPGVAVSTGKPAGCPARLGELRRTRRAGRRSRRADRRRRCSRPPSASRPRAASAARSGSRATSLASLAIERLDHGEEIGVRRHPARARRA